MRLPAAAVATALLVPLAVAAIPSSSTASTTQSARAAGCDPFTKAVYAGKVPDPVDMFGFAFGDKEVGNSQAKRYMLAADEASPRIRTGVLATTALGRQVMYSVVGNRKDVAAAQRAARILRNPHTSQAKAKRVAAHAPAIAFDIANVHGNEPSGADAALRIIRDIADRTDCAGRQVRKNVVTVVIPIQNPDGRWLDYRRNSYGFDMNRDWFSRTQPETDGKVQLMRKFPPVLAIDAHEMGSNGFFFPPDADPVYHEIADRSIDWINNLYGASMAKEFDDRGLSYFNYSTYDMFYIGYGDTVPTEGFLSAGMTFEKDGYDPVRQRVRQQYITAWTSISALATHKTKVLKQWAASYREAYREGLQGKLEPNRVFQASSTLQQRVPKQRVRNYFILPSRQKAAEVQSLVRRLQRMDVAVRRLTAPLHIRDFHAYGTTGSRPTTLPRGTYWITMAQAQKHWIQAMMGEDSYVPFPYFYDVTAWSSPLLFNVAGGRSGATVHARSVPVRQLPAPRPPGDGAHSPNVGMWYLDPISSSSYESEGWMRWLYENKWYLPYQLVQSDRIKFGSLRQLDVLVAPSGYAPLAWNLLGERGRKALRHWVARGGRLVTMGASTELAARLGLTTARLRSPRSDIPGSLIHAKVDRGPLSRGVGNDVWSFYEYDNVMHAPSSDVAVSFPSIKSKLWQISGYARGARELAGSAAVVDERYRSGRVVSFAADPNFRAYTDGTQKILWNAIYGGNPTFAQPGGATKQAALDTARAKAVRASGDLRSYANKMVITVPAEASSKVAQLIASYGHSSVSVALGHGLVQYLVRTGPAEASRFANSLARDLATMVPSVVAVRLPS